MTMQKKMLKTAAAACAAALAAVLLAGCGDEASKKTYSPVPFTKHDRCHLCGMVLAHYEGPKAQIIIKGAEDTPLMFCSGRDAFSPRGLAADRHGGDGLRQVRVVESAVVLLAGNAVEVEAVVRTG